MCSAMYYPFGDRDRTFSNSVFLSTALSTIPDIILLHANSCSAKYLNFKCIGLFFMPMHILGIICNIAKLCQRHTLPWCFMSSLPSPIQTFSRCALIASYYFQNCLQSEVLYLLFTDSQYVLPFSLYNRELIINNLCEVKTIRGFLKTPFSVFHSLC